MSSRHDYRDTKLCTISDYVVWVLNRIVPLSFFNTHSTCCGWGPQHTLWFRYKKKIFWLTLLYRGMTYMYLITFWSRWILVTHVRIQEFLLGGVGSFRPDGQKTVRTNFYLFICLSPHRRILQFTGGVQWFTRGKSILFQSSRVSPTLSREWESNFPGGSNFFQRGIHLLISRNPYNLWFSRGDLTPYPPSGSAHVKIIETINCVTSVPMVFKRSVPLRRFFWIPTAHVVAEI